MSYKIKLKNRGEFWTDEIDVNRDDVRFTINNKSYFVPMTSVLYIQKEAEHDAN